MFISCSLAVCSHQKIKKVILNADNELMHNTVILCDALNKFKVYGSSWLFSPLIVQAVLTLLTCLIRDFMYFNKDTVNMSVLQ